MKYLINIIITILTISLCIQAQNIIFEYDAAGNRVQRYANEACFTNPPEQPRVLTTGNTNATLSWYANEAITALQYKQQGGQWQTITTAQPFAQFNNLQRCQSYVARLQYSCAGIIKYTPQVNFTTTDCSNSCNANEVQIFAQPSSQSMTINWDIYPGTLYILHYRKAGERNFATYTATQPFALLFDLEQCTTYEFALKLVCRDDSITSLGNIYRFSTKGCRLGDEAVLPVVSVYPNPAKSYIAIQLNSEKPVDLLVIYNSVGSIVKHIQPQAGQRNYELNIDDLASGIYLIKAQMGDVVESTKFSVQ